MSTAPDYNCPCCDRITGVQPPRWCGGCRKTCPHDDGVYVQHDVARNGVDVYVRRCYICHEHRGAAPHRDVIAGKYVIVEGHSNVTGAACGHCGATGGVETHHYAPRALFPDADNWPTGYLCRPCHQHWHRTINATRRKATRA